MKTKGINKPEIGIEESNYMSEIQEDCTKQFSSFKQNTYPMK